jgi:hypothetical protein
VIGQGSILCLTCAAMGVRFLFRVTLLAIIWRRGRLQRGCSMAKGVIDPYQSKCGSVVL